MSAKFKILSSIIVIALLSITTFGILIYSTSTKKMEDETLANAKTLANRSVQMFVVSTKSFYEEWENAKGDNKRRQEILDDWTRTIFAVDKAVTHDFGKGQSRVRLIGSGELTGIEPLGGVNTEISEEFEKSYLEKFVKGEKQILSRSDNMLRLALPLPSQAHPGCITCHVANVYGVEAVDQPHPLMNKNFVMGSLNIYIPLEKHKSDNKKFLFKFGGSLGIVFLLVILAIFISVNRLILSPFKGLSEKLNSSSQDIKDYSETLKETNEKLSRSTSSQLDSITETVSSLGEIENMVNKNISSAERSHESSRKSEKTVEDGKLAIDKVVSSITNISSNNQDIANQIEENNRDISEIVNIIEEIGEKTAVINDIVFQTKLLSFNASVEAARAGEHGKGFAVVAEEVGVLATSSGKAAQEITEMLDQSTKKVRDVVANTQKQIQGLLEIGKDRIEVGTTSAKQCNELFEEINNSVTTVTGLIDGIKLASQDQGQGINGITQAMDSINEVTNENSNISLESLQLSNNLSEQSRLLNDLSKKMMEIIEGK